MMISNLAGYFQVKKMENENFLRMRVVQAPLVLE